MPLSPIERIRLDKATVDEGVGLKRPDDGDWLAYESLGAPAPIRLTCAEPNYLVAVNHPGTANLRGLRHEKGLSQDDLPTKRRSAAAISRSSERTPINASLKIVDQPRRSMIDGAVGERDSVQDKFSRTSPLSHDRSVGIARTRTIGSPSSATMARRGCRACRSRRRGDTRARCLRR
jgi:hypothetical protein